MADAQGLHQECSVLSTFNILIMYKLTHVQLTDKTCNVAVLEIQGQDFLREAALIKHVETFPRLKQMKRN